MQTFVMILVAFVREIALSRATLRLENIASTAGRAGVEQGSTTCEAG